MTAPLPLRADGRDERADEPHVSARPPLREVTPSTGRSPESAAPRLVFVIEALTVGGAEQTLVSLANRCLARGWDVHVICLTLRGELADRLHQDIPVHVLDKRPRIDLRLPFRLRRLMRSLAPQAINSHLWVANFWTRASLAGTGMPVIATEHSRDSWKPRHYRLLDRCLVPFTHALVAVSEDTAHFYRREIGVRDDLVRVINNGVDVKRFAASDGRELRAGWAPNGEFLVGSVGRLVEAKNHERLLDMTVRLQAEGLTRLRVVIVGEGPGRAALERRIADLGLGEVVTLAGQRDDIPDVLAALDVFVLSSDREGHPVTALEAQAAGTPVVLTDAGGSTDAIARDGSHRGGLLVAPCAEALATAVRMLADDPDRRRQMGEFAREHARRNFDTEGTVDAYVALFGPAPHRPSSAR